MNESKFRHGIRPYNAQNRENAWDNKMTFTCKNSDGKVKDKACNLYANIRAYLCLMNLPAISAMLFFVIY